MRAVRNTAIKFGIFAVSATLLLATLFMAFSHYRGGAANEYSAVFADVSGLKAGDTVRIGGVPIGTVAKVTLRKDNSVLVNFTADRDTVLTLGTKTAVRYLNVTGDRYLELLDDAGPTQVLSPGSQIPPERTASALDLDVLLGGLKPVIRGLNPDDVNALTASMLRVLQDQGSTLDSVLAQTASFSNAIADHSQVIESLIDNLNTVITKLSDKGNQFGHAIEGLEELVKGLSADRDPIGAAIDSLSKGTQSVAGLLGATRTPLKGTVEQLNRVAGLLDAGKERIDIALQKAPENYRKLVRVGSYGSWLNLYLCGIGLRVSDLQGRTVVLPWVEQDTGRCAEP